MSLVACAGLEGCEAFRGWSLLELVCHSGKALRFASPALPSDSIQCEQTLHTPVAVRVSPSVQNLEDKPYSLGASCQAFGHGNEN